MTLDDSFSGRDGFAKLPQVARPFPFTDRLPSASFPKGFVDYYVTFGMDDPIDYDGERIFFLARFANGAEICFYDALFSPQMIQSQNGIISESIYAEPDAVIMPPGHYAFGAAYGEVTEMRLMVNLEEKSPDYGKIYAWELAHDPLGTGDNTRGLGEVAPDLRTFILGLQPREAL